MKGEKTHPHFSRIFPLETTEQFYRRPWNPSDPSSKWGERRRRRGDYWETRREMDLTGQEGVIRKHILSRPHCFSRPLDYHNNDPKSWCRQTLSMLSNTHLAEAFGNKWSQSDILCSPFVDTNGSSTAPPGTKLHSYSSQISQVVKGRRLTYPVQPGCSGKICRYSSGEFLNISTGFHNISDTSRQQIQQYQSPDVYNVFYQ